jgi:large subunit ribosomal protein L28
MYGKIAGLEDVFFEFDNPISIHWIAVKFYKGIIKQFIFHEGHAMAKCESCGKTTQFGQNRPWSKKSTKRKFKPNLQKVTVYEDGKKVSKVLCTRCIRSLTKV